MEKTKGSPGSITAEASIAMPVFLCVILTIALFMRIVYIHEIIQHAVTETAKEMASYSYLLTVCNINDVNDAVNDTLGQDAQGPKSRLEQLTQAFSSLNQQGLSDAADTLGEIVKDPTQDLKSVLLSMGDAAFENGKTTLMVPMIKGIAGKYLKNNHADAGQRLQNLGVIDAMEGLDFTQSGILEDNKNLDIVVGYRIKSFLPIKFLQVIELRQRVFMGAWLDGENDAAEIREDTGASGQCSSNAGSVADEVKLVEEDPWKLTNIPRGRKIEEIMGGNLGQYFPAVDKLENRTVYRIISMDTGASTHQIYGNLYKSLQVEVDELAKFEEEVKFEVKVGRKDYDNKVVNIAIPDKELNQEQINAIKDARIYAGQRGVGFRVTVVRAETKQ